MARKYGKKASQKVEKAMHEHKAGTLKSGTSTTPSTNTLAPATSGDLLIAIGVFDTPSNGTAPKKSRPPTIACT